MLEQLPFHIIYGSCLTGLGASCHPWGHCIVPFDYLEQNCLYQNVDHMSLEITLGLDRRRGDGRCLAALQSLLALKKQYNLLFPIDCTPFEVSTFTPCIKSCSEQNKTNNIMH